MENDPTPRLSLAPQPQLSVQFAARHNTQAHRGALPRHFILRCVRYALFSDVVTAELTVRIVDTPEAHSLNHTYRQRDYATNILTFHYTYAPNICADLVLCAAVVEAEAKQQHKTLQAHYAHLLVHGTLHAQGLDHEQDEAAALAMEAHEVRILANLGFANPYIEAS